MDSKKEKGKDTFSYKGWLISDNFFKRCFAVLGYYSMASILIWVGIILLAVAFFLVNFLVGRF